MVGDWVYAIDANGEKHPCRANNLEYDYTNKRGDFCVDFYGTGYEAEWPDIAFNVEPIPLTPEILEKNGFDINGIPEDMEPVEERDWSDDTYVWSRQETPYESTEVCVYMEDPDNFFAEIICQHCHVDGVHIKYVHELQHCLKLCGINKNIEL